MLVGDVAWFRSPGASDAWMLSAGRPVFSGVIATMLRQVSVAHRCRRELSTAEGACRRAGARAAEEAFGASAKAATEAAPPTSSARRVGVRPPRAAGIEVVSDMGSAPFRDRFTHVSWGVLAGASGLGCRSLDAGRR